MIALRHDQRGQPGAPRSSGFSPPSHAVPPQPLRHRAGPPRPPRSPHARHHRAPPPHGTSAIAGELLRTRCSDTNCCCRLALALAYLSQLSCSAADRGRRRREEEDTGGHRRFPALKRQHPRARTRSQAPLQVTQAEGDLIHALLTHPRCARTRPTIRMRRLRSRRAPTRWARLEPAWITSVYPYPVTISNEHALTPTPAHARSPQTWHVRAHSPATTDLSMAYSHHSRPKT